MMNADLNNELQVAEAFRKGEPAALNILWKNHYKALVYFADQLVRNNLLSEDIVSETFVKVWNMRDRFDNVHSIKAFLYVTVRNTCYDHLRSQEIHARIHKEILYTADSYATEMNRDDYDMMYAEYIQQLYEQVKNLPDRCQEVFKLYFFNRNSTREIADLLNISEQTVRNQKTKAIHMLRSVLLKKDMLPACVLPLVALLFTVED
jgi:RNA polymerase sigma-70 factor (ECF subfamily)